MNIVIIGNGITGITAARHIRKLSDHKITVISSESKYFFSRTALMYIYMGHEKFENTKPYEDWFWEKNRIGLINDYVKEIEISKKQLSLATGITVNYDKLIIATGSKPNKFGWKGQDLAGVQGLYSLQDLNLMEDNSRNISRAVIVGGGLIGIEMAEMLHSRKIPVSMLVRENSYWNNILPAEESEMINRHINEQGIDLRLSAQLKEIVSDDNGRVRSVITDKEEEIKCNFVGLTAGVSPNIDLVKNTEIESGRGILVNEYFETNIEDIFSAGDCAEIKSVDGSRNKIEQLWYTGRMHAETLAQTICGRRTKYDRGTLFNSAKFFDIEYHTYGLVNMKTPDEKNLYWEHSDGKHSIRIVYNNESVIGFNLMGIRYRHDVCKHWIESKKSIEFVLQNLGAANFDPEFFKKYENEVVEIYNNQNPDKKVSLNRKSKFFNLTKAV